MRRAAAEAGSATTCWSTVRNSASPCTSDLIDDFACGHRNRLRNKTNTKPKMNMKTNLLKLAILAFVPAAMLTFTSCSTTTGTEEVTALETADGMAIVDTYRINATVTGIDATKRKITLTTADGKRTTVKCGLEVANFSQIQINDRVSVTTTEE